MPLSMFKGCSGCMLSISFSTGIVGADVLAAVAGSSGVVIGIPELEGRNFSGYLITGSGAAAGMGFTSSGVTITISSVLLLVLEMDWKNLPRMGTSPMKGIFERV